MKSFTRTVNPIHFEHLEPHRFEDLVRQLVYRFRNWHLLEPTGRLGRDGGVDIRGVESPAPVELGVELPDAEDRVAVGPAGTEREWRIQCKRVQRLNPKMIAAVVREAVPDPVAAPHGLLLAVSSDISAAALSTFHLEASTRGVREHHVWTRSSIEDRLFLAENDDLLFAYFGLSLQTHVRARSSTLRRTLATKHRLLRAFGVDSNNIGRRRFDDLAIRDVMADGYPKDEHGQLAPPGLSLDAPFQTAAVVAFYPRGVYVCRFFLDGWIRDNGDWSFDEVSRRSAGNVGLRIPREPPSGTGAELPEQQPAAKPSSNPADASDRERTLIREYRLLPYDSILEVDPIGDAVCPGVHVYCTYERGTGPFADCVAFDADRTGRSHIELDPSRRCAFTRYGG